MRPAFFDRVLGWATAGLRERVRNETIQAMEGLGYGPGFNGEKWPGGLDRSAPSAIDHWALRQNGRKVAMESPEARALLRSSTNLVVGTGATLNLEPKYDLLGISAEEAEAWARNAELLFDLWASSPAQHKSGQFCWYEAMRLIYTGHKRESEFFIRLYYNTSDPSLILPLQFEILDPNQIRGDAYTTVTGLNGLMDDGITRDSTGYETTYKVWVQAGQFRYEAVEIPRTGPKSGRVYMIHGFLPELPGQGRGFSEFGLDIQNYKSITDFKAASLEKAKKQSNILLSLESDSDAPTMAPPGFSGGGVGIPSTPSAATGAGDEPAALPSYHRIPGERLPPGSMAIVDQPGKQRVKPFESTAPVPGQAEYIKGELEPLFAASGTSLEIVYRTFRNNYSASQATLLLNNLDNDVELFHLACQALDPVLLMFFSCAIAAGKIQAPGWQDPLLRAAWLAHRWSRPPMPNIDREKSYNADKGYVSIGADDLEAVAMRLNGSSYRSNVAKLGRQYRDLPTPPWGFGGAGGSPAPAKPAPQDDEGDDEDQKDDGGNE